MSFSLPAFSLAAVLPAPLVLGLDIGADQIRLAVRRRHRILALARHPLPPGTCQAGQIGNLDLLVQACRTLLQQQRIRHGVLCTALPASAVTQWPLTLPAQSAAHARAAQVDADCATRHGALAEQSILDYRELATPHPGEISLLAACAPALLVEDQLALASALRLRRGAITLLEPRCAAFLCRGRTPLPVLHVSPHSSWLVVAGVVHALAWRAGQHGSAALILELAPWLQQAPGLLLTGETGERDGLAALARIISHYAGMAVEVAGWPVGRLLPPPEIDDLPAFHVALALADWGRP